MFDKGRRVCFRDTLFRTHVGTIMEKIDENPATVILSVKSDTDGKTYIVKKVNPDIAHIKKAKSFYNQHGHY